MHTNGKPRKRHVLILDDDIALAWPLKETHRIWASWHNLPELYRRVRKMEQQLAQLTATLERKSEA